MLLGPMCHPGCSIAEDKTGTLQAVSDTTENSNQTTDQAPSQKKTASKVETLAPIVVTATRTEKSLADAPAAVSVVTSNDIESRNIQTVDQAIDLLPGVFDLRRKPLDTTGQVMMWGIPGQQRNLVLLDGQPLNNGFTGQVNWNSISPEDIARIEVVRGAFSALYGGDAMGGVINMITKTPQKREVTIQSGYGSYNTWAEYASYGDKFYNRLSVFASFGYKQSDGYPTVPVSVSPGGVPPGTPVRGVIPTTDAYGNPLYGIGNAGDNNWWTQSASVKFVYDINEDSKASFSYRNNQYGYGYGNPQSFLYDSHGNNIFSGNLSYNGVPFSVTTEDFLVDKGAYNENMYYGDYKTRLFGNAFLTISGGAIDAPDNWYDLPTSSTATHSGGPGKISSNSFHMYNTDVHVSFPLCEKHLITFGGAFRHDEAANPTTNLSDWTDPNSQTDLVSDTKGKDNISSFYAEAQIALLPNLTLYAGARGDYWRTYDGLAVLAGVPGYPQHYGSNSDFSVNPKGALVYEPLDGTTLKASVGTAFRPPTIYELYTSWEYYGMTFLANPNLKPETSFSWDLGVEQKLGSRTVCKLNYFHNTISDYIYTGSVNGSYYTFQRTNAGKAETDGVDLEIDTRPWDCLKLFANATYTHSEMLSNSADPLSVGKQLQYVPKWMFNAGGELNYGKFSFTLTGRYADKQYGNADNLDKVSGVYGSYDSFFVVDSKVRYKLTHWATLNFAVSNITDEKYYSYYQEPGRTFFGGMTVKF